jgi:peptidoglycan LD-endopeptidase CwlK
MSTLFSPDSKFLQRFLSSGGFYKGDIDGDVGSGTKAALGDFAAQTKQVTNDLGSFDKTTESKIGTMLIPTQRKAREFMKSISQANVSQGLSVRIISGTRTFDEQDELFAQGRTKRGKIVTNARGGFSNHNFRDRLGRRNFQ